MTILADVYLAMTRQQGTMFVREVANAASPDHPTQRPVRRNHPPLPVIRADAGECAEHARYLELLDKSSGGACVWRRLESA